MKFWDADTGEEVHLDSSDGGCTLHVTYHTEDGLIDQGRSKELHHPEITFHFNSMVITGFYNTTNLTYGLWSTEVVTCKKRRKEK